MIKDIFILGSTGSIGETVLNIVRKDKKKFRIRLLTTNTNVRKIYNQAIEFDVKEIVIFDQIEYQKSKKKFKNKKINI